MRERQRKLVGGHTRALVVALGTDHLNGRRRSLRTPKASLNGRCVIIMGAASSATGVPLPGGQQRIQQRLPGMEVRSLKRSEGGGKIYQTVSRRTVK